MPGRSGNAVALAALPMAAMAVAYAS